MTDEEKRQMRKQAKIERLEWLRKQYRMLEAGATPREKQAIVCESAILSKRLEVAQRGAR